MNVGGINSFAKGLSTSENQSGSTDKQGIDIPVQVAIPTPTIVPTLTATAVPTATVLKTPAANDPKVLDILKGFTAPIKGAKLPTYDGQLPNALRSYRSGVHEGIDFYDGWVGVPVKLGTQVLAAKSGVVIRVDTNYVGPSEQQVNEWEAESEKLGYTPEDLLDAFRGRQVWIDHGNNIITRYSHLSGIAPGIVPGKNVEGGELIGYVGNSGTPEAAGGTNDDIHLHFEIRIGDQYFGQGLTVAQIKDWMKKIFAQ